MPQARLAFFLFLAACLARTVSSMGTLFFSIDGATYLIMADWMREGRFQDALSMAYHPLYPLLTAVARGLAGNTQVAATGVSVALGAAAIVPLFFTVQSMFGRSVAFLSSVMYAFHPKIVEVQSDTMTEGAFFFFFLLSMWLTWRMMEQPSLERGATLGLAAAGAFLVRPEGLLAVALALFWPIVELVRSPGDRLRRLGALAAAAVVILLLAAPYLFWVRSIRGHWAPSIRPSTISMEHAVGISGEEGSAGRQGRLYLKFGHSLVRLTVYGSLLPLYVLGLSRLRGVPLRHGLFYFSFPVGFMVGVLLALRAHNVMSDRYILLPISLLFALAAQGTMMVLHFIARQWPGATWRPALSAGFVLLVAVIPGVHNLRIRRQECLSYPVAAQWILSQGLRPMTMSGLTPEVGYLTGSRPLPVIEDPNWIKDQVKRQGAEYFAYPEGAFLSGQQYVRNLQSCELLEPPVVISGPPGSDRVYVQLVKERR
jgi:4-amino-4-deoxy-L-arabinose transferase-like glycosyltransferase